MKVKVVYNLKKAWLERSSISGEYGNKTLLAEVNGAEISLVYEKEGDYYKIVASDKQILLTEVTVENLKELKKEYKNILKSISKGEL